MGYHHNSVFCSTGLTNAAYTANQPAYIILLHAYNCLDSSPLLFISSVHVIAFHCKYFIPFVDIAEYAKILVNLSFRDRYCILNIRLDFWLDIGVHKIV